ncbi:MAG: AsmA-like C-terminal region-containing protein [Saprospiraceae bacterium]
MSKSIKNIFKIIGFVFIGLIVAGFILPFVFKDKIYGYIQKNINNAVDAQVSFSDIDLSFFRSFPDVKLTIDSLKVLGINDFDGITLYKAPKTHLDLDIKSIIGKGLKPKINEIHLESPTIHVIVLNDTLANYIITPPDTTSTPSEPFSLEIQKFRIDNGKLIYDDKMRSVDVYATQINHTGKGDFTKDIFDLTTKTTIDTLNVSMDNMRYLTRVKAGLDADINMNFIEQKFTLKNNILRLNDLDAQGTGTVQFVKDDDMMVDVTFQTKGESFKSLLSLIPNAYTSDFKDVKTSGTAKIGGVIKGKYNSTTLPGIDINILIDKGYFKYPALPSDVSNVNAKLRIFAQHPQYKDMTLDIPTFSMQIGNDPVKGRLYVGNAMGDQKLDGDFEGKLDIGVLSRAFPMPDLKSLAGFMDARLSFKAKMSDINNSNYGEIAFDGKGIMKDFQVKYGTYPEVSIPNLSFSAKPEEFYLTSDKMQLGKSDVAIDMKVENPLAVFSTSVDSKVNMSVDSRYFNADEWMTQSTTEEPSGTAVPINPSTYSNASATIKANLEKVDYDGKQLEHVKLDGSLATNAIKVNTMEGKMGKSDFKISGFLNNAVAYLLQNETLSGEVSLQSQVLDLNQFMETSTTANNEPMQVIPVPKNIHLNLKSDIKTLYYTNHVLTNLEGKMNIHDQQIDMSDVTTQILGGKIAMQGMYNSQDIKKPEYSIKLDLQKIQFKDAAKQFVTFKNLAPIAEYIEGFFNTSLIMSGTLGNDMVPQLSTLDASGLLETLSGSISGFKPLGDLATKLNIPQLKDVKLTNTKNWFEIVKGFVEMKDYHTSFNGIDMKINGKHGFGKSMDYTFDMVIPRKLMEKNNITSTANTGLSLLQNEASKLGISIGNTDFIYLTVKMTGDFKNPKFQIIPKLSDKVSNDDLVKAAVAEAEQKIKDSINQVINKQGEILKDTVSKIANKEIEKAKQKAQEEAQKALDSLKKEAEKKVISKLDTLTSGIVSDSLKQKAKDILEKQSNEEINKIKDKIEDFNPFKKKKGK